MPFDPSGSLHTCGAGPRFRSAPAGLPGALGRCELLVKGAWRPVSQKRADRTGRARQRRAEHWLVLSSIFLMQWLLPDPLEDVNLP